MKIKNALKAKMRPRAQLCAQTYFKICVVLIFLLSACKKELLISEKIEHPHEGKITDISYSKFLASVNTEKLVSLIPVLSSSSGGNGKLMSAAESNSNFTLDTGNVKKLVRGDTVSYVLALRSKTKRAIIFENITVQIIKQKTTAFLSIYAPTKGWIKSWRDNKYTPFRGDIHIRELSLDALPRLNLEGNGGSNSKGVLMSLSNNNLVVNGKLLTLSPTGCDVYDVFTIIPTPCKYGHMFRADCNYFEYHGTWDLVPGEDDYPPSLEIAKTSIVNCNDPSSPEGPSGGGGGTTPNLPGEYDPCDSGGGGGEISIIDNPQTPCDGSTGQPSLPSQVNSLIVALGLTGNDLTYVSNNPTFAVELYSLLQADEFSIESVLAAKMTVFAANNHVFASTNDYFYYSSTWANIDGIYPYSPQTMAVYHAIQCSIIQLEHPEFSSWRIHWEASKEMLHLLLDGIGLIPGAGEIADLTNGVIYTIEGRGVDATLSYAAAIPIAGWFATGAKFAKRTITVASGSRTTLKWAVMAGNLVKFGDRAQLRKILNMAVGDLRQAHHILPWAKQTHPVIQKAAKAPNPFHMNQAANGIALDNARHLGSHSNYDNRVLQRLNTFINSYPNATATQCNDALVDIISDIRTAIQNNPTTHIDQLIF